jgi:putative hydrolase of the HAD superfamily
MPDNARVILTTPECFQKIFRANPSAQPPAENRGCLDGWRVEALPAHAGASSFPWGAHSLAEAPADRVYLDRAYPHLQDRTSKAWRTAWLNPDGRLVAHPAHDLDLISLAGLTAQLEGRHAPGLQICESWREAWSLPQNIRQHADRVAWLAYALAVALRQKGKIVDPILAHRGGLLHDLDKIDTLDEGHLHGMRGAAFVEDQGFPVLAGIIRNHVLRMDLSSKINDWSWEEKLVFFCDKLIEGDRLVPFPVRLSALKKRYPASQKVLTASEPVVFRLSDELCSILSISGHEKLISWLDNLQNI